MTAQVTRREGMALAAAAALAASPPLPARSAVAAILELRPYYWQDGSIWMGALVDHLGWTKDRAFRVVKATLHDYCTLPYEHYGPGTWVSLLRHELDRALTDPGYDERPDVIERARIGKSAKSRSA